MLIQAVSSLSPHSPQSVPAVVMVCLEPRLFLLLEHGLLQKADIKIWPGTAGYILSEHGSIGPIPLEH